MLLRSTDFGYYYVLRLDFSFKNNFDHWPVHWLDFGIKLIEDIKYVCLYATKCSLCKNLQMKDKSYQVILTMRSPVWIDRYNSVDAHKWSYQTKESVCIKRRIGKLQLAKNIKTTSVLLQKPPKVSLAFYQTKWYEHVIIGSQGLIDIVWMCKEISWKYGLWQKRCWY